MKFTTLLTIAAASTLWTSGTFAQAPETPQRPQDTIRHPQKAGKNAKNEAATDARRIRQLALANIAEVEAGKLALEKARDPKVKEFAQHMVDDHSKMLDEVKKLAQSKGVELPTTPDAKHRKTMKNLQSTPAGNFDRQFMRGMVRDHREALKLAQSTAKSAKDAELKAAAQKAVPDIQQHLKTAENLSRSQKRAASGRTSG